MNTDPVVTGPPVIEKFTQLSTLALGYTAAICVALVLFLAWIITAPIFHLSDLFRARFGAKMKVKKYE
jgi:small neutral amino acid transporter SnatA (MarC family)